jgi:hypothetical protein
MQLPGSIAKPDISNVDEGRRPRKKKKPACAYGLLSTSLLSQCRGWVEVESHRLDVIGIGIVGPPFRECSMVATRNSEAASIDLTGRKNDSWGILCDKGTQFLVCSRKPEISYSNNRPTALSLSMPECK